MFPDSLQCQLCSDTCHQIIYIVFWALSFIMSIVSIGSCDQVMEPPAMSTVMINPCLHSDI